MTRRCSHCSHNGHNSRTCPNRGVKLFGVRLTDGSSIRKSASMGNLSLLAGSGGGASPPEGAETAADGYASEDFAQGSSSSCRERKKGTPWTEEEHKMFLLGLKKLGKGDWRGISRNYVVTRTPTQVASHAQKYFIRQTNMSRRKRRSSLFDMIPDEWNQQTSILGGASLAYSFNLTPPFGSSCASMVDGSFYGPLTQSTGEPLEPQPFPVNCQVSEQQTGNPTSLPPTVDEEYESMDPSNSMVAEAALPQPETLMCNYPVMLPAYFSPLVQFSLPFWPGYRADFSEQQVHEIVKPTAVHSKTSINVDELVSMSKLSIGEHSGEASSVSLDLLGGSNRQSAFHSNPPAKAQA